jgi:hypothetical protein
MCLSLGQTLTYQHDESMFLIEVCLNDEYGRQNDERIRQYDKRTAYKYGTHLGRRLTNFDQVMLVSVGVNPSRCMTDPSPVLTSREAV